MYNIFKKNSSQEAAMTMQFGEYSFFLHATTLLPRGTFLGFEVVFPELAVTPCIWLPFLFITWSLPRFSGLSPMFYGRHTITLKVKEPITILRLNKQFCFLPCKSQNVFLLKMSMQICLISLELIGAVTQKNQQKDTVALIS